ncbi:hypothetical protein D3C75_928030 [compost metagenome]
MGVAVVNSAGVSMGMVAAVNGETSDAMAEGAVSRGVGAGSAGCISMAAAAPPSTRTPRGARIIQVFSGLFDLRAPLRA